MSRAGNAPDQQHASCAHCDKPVLDSQAYWELRCKRHLSHMSHGKRDCPLSECAAEAPVPSKYDASGGPVAFASQALPGARADPDAARAAVSPAAAERKSRAARRLSEPLHPYRPGLGGRVLGAVASAVYNNRWTNKGDTSPFALLKQQVPLDSVMVEQHGYDITELINDHGVTINDFFENGYTMAEMCEAFRSRMNDIEGLDVLYYLGTDAEHFRTVPDLMNVPLISKKLGYTGHSLAHFGYSFEPGAWTLREMIGAGLTMSTVMELGMSTKQEWNQLRYRATPQQLAAFQYSPALEASLTDARQVRAEEPETRVQEQHPSPLLPPTRPTARAQPSPNVVEVKSALETPPVPELAGPVRKPVKLSPAPRLLPVSVRGRRP